MSSLRKRNPTLGVVFALTGALLFGLNASTSKVLIHSGINPAVLVFYRSLATAVLAATVLALTKPSGFKIRWREVPALALFGVVGVALMQWSYSQAVSNLQVGVALLIEYTAIIWVPLATWAIFREPLKARIFAAVALVLCGLAVVANFGQTNLNPTGVAFAFLAAKFLTVYFILGERIQKTRDTFSTLFYTMAISAVFWAIFAPLQSFDLGSLAQSTSLLGNLSSVELPLWSMLIWIAVFGSFVPMLLSYRALHHLSATGVGIASTSETVFALAFGFFWLGENASGTQLIGSVLVVVGIVLAQTARERKEELK